MYAKNKKPVALEELDWNQFIKLQRRFEETGEGPLMKIPFSLNTPYLQKDFHLDLIIWNLSKDKMELVQKVVFYVLQNFNKLFETGWTVLYYESINFDPEIAEHTLSEFYKEQIDFESSYYSIQLEINSDHLTDGIARYCFVVSTVCNYRKWMISDDDMRVYMVDNKCCKFDTNNDDMQMTEMNINFLYGNAEQVKKIFSTEYKKMEQEGFQYAESFQEFKHRTTLHD